MQISSSDLLLCFYGYKHVQCFVDKYMVFKLYSGIKKIIWEYRLRPSWEYLQLLKSYPCQVKRWFTQV